MKHMISLVRSDLFFSLAGGFAIGVAGIAFVKPASADSLVEDTRFISVSVIENDSDIRN